MTKLYCGWSSSFNFRKCIPCRLHKSTFHDDNYQSLNILGNTATLSVSKDSFTPQHMQGADESTMATAQRSRLLPVPATAAPSWRLQSPSQPLALRTELSGTTIRKYYNIFLSFQYECNIRFKQLPTNSLTTIHWQHTSTSHPEQWATHLHRRIHLNFSSCPAVKE